MYTCTMVLDEQWDYNALGAHRRHQVQFTSIVAFLPIIHTTYDISYGSPTRTSRRQTASSTDVHESRTRSPRAIETIARPATAGSSTQRDLVALASPFLLPADSTPPTTSASTASVLPIVRVILVRPHPAANHALWVDQPTLYSAQNASGTF